jgi:DNA-binding transcriptional LysR family regulator
MLTERLRGADLDLLVVLDALLEEENVTAAAHRLALTPSAVSRSLGRLRELFGDELMVRTGRGMRPTARARELEAPLRRLLRDADRLLKPSAFDPETTARRYRIATADYGAVVLVEPLFHQLQREAPRLDLDLVPFEASGERALETGELDLAIGPRSVQAAGVVWTELFVDDFCCVLDEKHPVRRLTRKRFLELPHVLVAPTGRPGGVVDDLLTAQGVSRRVALRTPSFLSVPGALVGTPCIATLPRRLAEAFVRDHPLRLVKPPLQVPTFTCYLGWHEVHRQDPSHRWLRERLAAHA